MALAEDDVSATEPFVRAVREAERLIASAEFVRTDADRAEGLDYLAGCIRGCLHNAWTFSRSHPQLVTSTGPFTKMGLDNPDTLYRHADVVADADYLLTGQRGTTADLSFQVLKGDYTAVDVPDGHDAFDDRRLAIADDGTFQLRFGSADSCFRDEPNFFVLGEGSSMLAVREVYSDWDELPGRIQIERVDTAGTAPAPSTPERAARRYETAGKLLLGRIQTWLQFPQWFYLNEPANTFTEPRLTPGGLSTQYSSVGHFDLEDDDALVVSVPKSDAPYQGFQLGSMWYVSLDYINHQTSLNSHQAQVDPDGHIRMVISARNPGVTNWIDTTGRSAGIMQFRWQRVDKPIGVDQTPQIARVKVDDVADYLPFFASNRIDAAAWGERIAQRQRQWAARELG